VAHPAALALALLVLRAQKAGKIRRVVATVLEPASEHGQKGMDELHEQTVNLLSFQELPKTVFDTQIAFNLAANYGPNSTPALETIEQRILKHYQRNRRKGCLAAFAAAGPGADLPRSCLLDPPGDGATGGPGGVVAGAGGGARHADSPGEDSPSNVNAAGQGDILVSLTRDENYENGAWIWAAVDNLRIAAATAVECAETMTPTRPRGKIQ